MYTKKIRISTLIVQNFALNILSMYSLCLGFANHVFQTNKLNTVHTLQCTLYTVHYVPHRPEFSTLETSEEGGRMRELMLFQIIFSAVSTCLVSLFTYS